MYAPDRELGDFLIDARLLSRTGLLEIAEKAKEEGQTLYERLHSQALLPEDELARAAAHVLGLPFTTPRHEDIEREALVLVPEPLSRARSLAGFRFAGGQGTPRALEVILLDTDDLASLKFLEEEQGMRLIPHLTDRASLKRALLMHQRILKDSYAERLARGEAGTAVDALLSHAALSRASEMHLTAREGTEDLVVRYRAQGILHDAMVLPRQRTLITGRLKELAGLSFTLSLPQKGSFRVVLKNGERLRVRVATLMSRAGEKMTLRLMSERGGSQGFAPESLGLHGEALESLHEMLEARSGLILSASPRGGGTTTALYTLLDALSSPGRLLMSVEEHTTVRLPQVTQVEVRADVGQTLASAVRAALKHHPDVLMISEIKNEETAALAASAAARGILVLAGVRAPSAAKAVHKMQTLDIPSSTLSSVFRGAMGTRVVRKLCPHCREEYTPTRAELAPLEAHANFSRALLALKTEGVADERAQWKEMRFFRAKGCKECDEGWRGKTGLQELLPVSETLKEFIAKDAATEELEKAGEMYLNLAEDGLYKAVLGETTLEEVAKALE